MIHDNDTWYDSEHKSDMTEWNDTHVTLYDSDHR